jgi:hypothetical protein
LAEGEYRSNDELAQRLPVVRIRQICWRGPCCLGR